MKREFYERARLQHIMHRASGEMRVLGAAGMIATFSLAKKSIPIPTENIQMVGAMFFASAYIATKLADDFSKALNERGNLRAAFKKHLVSISVFPMLMTCLATDSFVSYLKQNSTAVHAATVHKNERAMAAKNSNHIKPISHERWCAGYKSPVPVENKSWEAYNCY